MSLVIDNDTQQIIGSAIGKLPTRSERALAYARTMRDLTSALNAPEPGGPLCEMSVSERIEAMTAAKTGGAYAEAAAMQERGYAIGHLPG